MVDRKPLDDRKKNPPPKETSKYNLHGPMNQNKKYTPTVFVSGATGYIAQHIIKQLLDSQAYRVVGSVRSMDKAARLHELFNNNTNLSFAVVDDLCKVDAFDQVFQDRGMEFDYIMHTATPVDLFCNDVQKSIILPAINGTKSIFQATVNYAPNVKKFVYTSSYGAMRSPQDNLDSNLTFDETSWNKLTLEEGLQNGKNAYHYAKANAEKLVWEWEKTLNAKFAVVTVSPTFTFGPQCFDASVGKTLNASCECINLLVHSKFGEPVNNAIKGNFADVRNVARAHVECITNARLNGNRLIINQGKFCLQLIANIVNDKFPQLRGKIAVGCPDTVDQVCRSFAHLNDKATKELLSFEFFSLSQSVTDTVAQILRVEEAS